MAVCAWLTGLSGAGKSTTANAAASLLAAHGHRVNVIDGDTLRRTTSSDLGFSRSDRHANVMRAAALARAYVHRGDLVVCALISPYREMRAAARELIGEDRFLEVFIDAPLAICEARDPKGLYALARRGLLKDFTGLDGPYEPPIRPDLILATTCHTVADTATRLAQLLATRLQLTAPGAPRRASLVPDPRTS
jgi:adenylyl-sulfate kinase